MIIMAPISCGLFRVPWERDTSDLIKKFRGYSGDELVDGNTLVTTVENIKTTSRGIQFSLVYDSIIPLKTREGIDYAKETNIVEIRHVGKIFSDAFMIFGVKKIRPQIAGKIAGIFNENPETYADLRIPPETITRVLANDSAGARFKIWKEIDAFTEMAALQGNIEESTHAAIFDESGRPVWVIFDSNFAGRTVGLSTGSIVFYGGDDLQEEELENYFVSVIRPNL